MTRGNVLASVLYNTSVSLKNRDFNKLSRKHNLDKLISSLSAMQFLTACIGANSISLSQAEQIITVLKVEYNYDTDQFSELLKEAEERSDHSPEYRDIIFQMHLILSVCINSVTEKRKGYTETVSRYIKAFHNFPRVFLSITNRSKISPSDAVEYSKSYLKSD